MVEIPCDCNECLRMLGLYPSNGVMDDITRRCRCRPLWNVNDDDDCVWELSGRIEGTETNWQQFNVSTAYPLLTDHIADVNPSLIKKQDNTPAFPLVLRSRSARTAAQYSVVCCHCGVCCHSARTQTDWSNCSPYTAVGFPQSPLPHHTCLVAFLSGFVVRKVGPRCGTLKKQGLFQTKTKMFPLRRKLDCPR